MTRTEATAWLQQKLDEVRRMKDEIDLLTEQGQSLEALAKLQEFIGLVDPDEALSVARIAEGQEAPS